MRITSTSQQTIFGITGKFKHNPSMLATRKRRSYIIHLVAAKPDMVIVEGQFRAAHDGLRLDVGEFLYRSPSQYLELTNSEVCTGLVEDFDANTFAIPMTFIPRSSIILSNIYAAEQEIIVSG